MKKYVYDVEMVQDRTGNYEKQEEIAKKFEVVEYPNMSYGASRMAVHDGKTFREEKDGDKMFGSDANINSLHNVISPHLLFYRLMIVFGKAVEMEQGAYKVSMLYTLKHNKTGEVFGFYDYKGSPGLFSSTEIGDATKKDIHELLNFLCSDECAHPYDRTVAGTQA